MENQIFGIKNISNAEYHASNGISKSSLFRIQKSPEWFKYCQDNPQEPTADMILGSAFHTLVLEPHKFESEFAILPQCDRRCKDGKALYFEFMSRSNGKNIISEEDYQTICGMRDKLLQYKLATALLKGQIEQSYYWQDDLTGELCRCRPDVIPNLEKPIIVDLKSCRNADTETFLRDSVKLGYDLQAAMYREGIDKITGKQHSFVFIAVEKTPPYAVNILKADDLFLKRGHEMFRELLGIYHTCKQTNNWYGYMGFANNINELSLPRWLVADYE